MSPAATTTGSLAVGVAVGTDGLIGGLVGGTTEVLVGVLVGGTGVLVGGTGVLVGGTGVLVAVGTGVRVGLWLVSRNSVELLARTTREPGGRAAAVAVPSRKSTRLARAISRCRVSISLLSF